MNQVNDLEHKEAKNNQSKQEEKIKKKKQGYCKEPLRQLQAFQHLHHRGARRKREKTRYWRSI